MAGQIDHIVILLGMAHFLYTPPPPPQDDSLPIDSHTSISGGVNTGPTLPTFDPLDSAVVDPILESSETRAATQQ